jgi:quercetin dioxygenase-like cupin family protein
MLSLPAVPTRTKTARILASTPKATDGVIAMRMHEIPFGTTVWADVPATRHPGETGVAHWRTRQFGDIRVRMVDYSPGYLADHWCEKGHILLVLEGRLETELADGRRVVLVAGESYQVADGAEPHRSRTGPEGARLFIVD